LNGSLFAGLIAIAAVGAAVYALAEPYLTRIVELEVRLAHLPASFDGFRILLLADLHTRKRGFLEERLARLLAREKADAIFVVGDSLKVLSAAPIVRELLNLIQCDGPRIAVLGNAEHKPWIDQAGVEEAVRSTGVELLVNSSTIISKDGESIRVAGVDDSFTCRADIAAAFSDVKEGEVVVFLTHCPSAAREAIQMGASLVLAGHTHGGQVRLPGLPMIWTHMRTNKHINDGLYVGTELTPVAIGQVNAPAVYVSRGLGTSRLPIRFRCRPEMTRITLRRA
jgi:uncharacterized protein